jgi:uncharacterized protein (TIGR02217 family)
MAFLEQRIDPRITHECRFTVEHPSRVKLYTGEGVLEGQQFGDVAPKHRVNLQHGIQNATQFATLVDTFYIILFTPYEGLRVKNWADYRATLTNSAVLSVGGGTYQLQRKHTFGGVNLLRNITKPCNDGSVIVYDASDTPLTPTINYATGTFTVAAGTPAKWAGNFDTPMTFESDKWEAQLIASGSGVLSASEPIWMEEVPGV